MVFQKITYVHNMNLSRTSFDETWTLFLDRDGVINTRIIGDYIVKWEQFEFIDGVLEALAHFSQLFHRIVIVTNQQGIGKGLHTEPELEQLHAKMLAVITESGGRVDAIYYSPYLAHENDPSRKPNIGMALQAKKDFPEIAFDKSIMVGDTQSDMEFGRNAGMKTVFIGKGNKNSQTNLIDWEFPSLAALSAALS